MNKKYYIGAMTGTSLDGIDISLCRFDKNETKYNYSLEKYIEYPISNVLKQEILAIISNSVNIKQISQLNFLISKLYSDSINKFIEENQIIKQEIIAIGMHGQTVWHQPIPEIIAGHLISSTLQLGDISVVAELTGIRTIGNFRSADIAVGGCGAPLVPIFDYHFLRSSCNIITLNIGGISNITYLPENCELSEIIAFDTGVGNVWIDIAMRHYFNQEYDSNGETAFSGNINYNLLSYLNKSFEFVKQVPPKSTGRELFSEERLLEIIRMFSEINPIDFIATLTEFTAQSIAFNIKEFANSKSTILVSGGGAKNCFLMKRLIDLLQNSKIETSESFGINPDAKESICFAFLAYLHLNEEFGNIPSVTGAKRRAVLGISSF